MWIVQIEDRYLIMILQFCIMKIESNPVMNLYKKERIYLMMWIYFLIKMHRNEEIISSNLWIRCIGICDTMMNVKWRSIEVLCKKVWKEAVSSEDSSEFQEEYHICSDHFYEIQEMEKNLWFNIIIELCNMCIDWAPK